MTDWADLCRRGLNRPEKLPRYLFGLLAPSSRWGPEWRKRDGTVLFEPGGYAASPRTRPEFASNLYREVDGLWAALDAHLDGGTVDRTLEVGCGYGRLSPWIATRAGSFVGVDPDERALGIARRQYPDLAFARGRAEALPIDDGSIDLLVTWTVLQHVADDRIADVVAEFRRTLSDDGVAVCCERVEPPGDDHLWPRSVESYDRLFDPMDLEGTYERPVEPTWGEAMATDRPPERVLVFRS
ncbi:class I SAM-dependent methyltransferase [Halosolutus gelatinilyticus]|uniref:class I SAM-dependent methyltransferase n=1 Tax=Halosolutus gelatinilyticus TaxID=2931975 RepID=UPI001FF2EAFF|nr:class I SAM-dependent methyltransferase [Halosolutus gelatinilyticus]